MSRRMDKPLSGNGIRAATKKKSMFLQVMCRMSENKMAMSGFVILILIMVVCAFAPFFAPHSPMDMDLAKINAGPSLSHLCGTDSLGRDIFSRLIYGGRYSLSIGIFASFLSMLAGVILGSISGYYMGKVDSIIMRIMDIWASIPGILLAIVISAVLGASFINTIFALSIGSVPMGVRIIRGQILGVRQSEYLEAAKAINCSSSRIMFLHLLPNVISPLLVATTMNIGMTITQAAALSVIGLGVQPPTPEWGAMLSAGRSFIAPYPHLVIFPGICIALTVLCINLMGDGLRDAMDPRLKS